MTDPEVTVTEPQPARRRSARRLFVLAGLGLLALTAWRERDLLHLGLLAQAAQETPLQDSPPVPPPTAPIARLRAALLVAEEASTAYSQAFDAWIDGRDVELITGPGSDGWDEFWTIRAKALPAYRAALQRLVDEALAARAADPDNGVYEVLAGLAELDLVCSPGSHDPLTGYVLDLDRSAPWIRVEEPDGLTRALARIDAGLSRASYTFRGSAWVEATTAIEGAPIERLARRLAAASQVRMPELMFVKGRCQFLAHLARRERLLERAPGAPRGGAQALLSRVRRIGLRTAAESSFIIETLVGQACVGIADDVWCDLAAQEGDLERTRAAGVEQLELTRRRLEARSVPRGTSLDRLGILDQALMPAGGWGEAARHDPRLARRFEQSVLESFVGLALMLLCVLGLSVAWWKAGRSAAPDAPPAAGFTLGDLLGVVLPSFGAVAVLSLLHARLHPSRQLGLGVAEAAQVAFLHGATLLLLAGGLFAWRLRLAALERHGLELLRPGAARAALWLGLGAAHVSLLWVSARDVALAPLAAGLGLGALVLAVRGGVLGRAASSHAAARAVARYEGRVGLAALGAALLVVCGVQHALVSPRRDAMARSLDAQTRRLFTHEAEWWGGGELLALHRKLLEHQPDAPALERPQ
jgi:hypothetical protein